MTIDPKFSLVRYDPHSGILGERSSAHMRPVRGRTSAAAQRYSTASAATLGARSLRQGQPQLAYSLRRTIVPSAVATGQVVDIFV